MVRLTSTVNRRGSPPRHEARSLAFPCRAAPARAAGRRQWYRPDASVTLNAAGQMVADRARHVLFETTRLARDLVLMQQQVMGRMQFGLDSPWPPACCPMCSTR